MTKNMMMKKPLIKFNLYETIIVATDTINTAPIYNIFVK